MMERFRAFWTKVFTPVARLFLRLGISPDAVTVVGTLGVCAGALIFFPQGKFLIGVLVCTAFVFSDMVDGQMARLSGRTSSWGAFLDSTLDRIGDGAIFGGLSPRVAIPELLSLYQEGQLKLDELVTTRYSLEDVNQGYQDMRDGKNIRGMIVYTDADR